MKTKTNLFYKHDYKNKSNFFSHIKLKLHPRTWKVTVAIHVTVTFHLTVTFHVTVTF